jgi:hypothetical protein
MNTMIPQSQISLSIFFINLSRKKYQAYKEAYFTKYIVYFIVLTAKNKYNKNIKDNKTSIK